MDSYLVGLLINHGNPPINIAIMVNLSCSTWRFCQRNLDQKRYEQCKTSVTWIRTIALIVVQYSDIFMTYALQIISKVTYIHNISLGLSMRYQFDRMVNIWLDQ